MTSQTALGLNQLCPTQMAYWARVVRHLLRKKAKPCPKKSQIVKNYEILAFFMCYHVFSKLVNKANSTVTDYAHGNLKFNHFQCITFAAWSLNNFEGSLSCWRNSPPMFLGFFMIHQVTDYCHSSEPFGIVVVWHTLQYAFSERSLAYFNQPKKCLFSLLSYICPLL